MEIAAVRFPVIIRRRAIGWLYHAVVHNFVPILSRHYAKEHRHAGNRWFEISASKLQRDYFWYIKRKQSKKKYYNRVKKNLVLEIILKDLY